MSVLEFAFVERFDVLLSVTISATVSVISVSVISVITAVTVSDTETVPVSVIVSVSAVFSVTAVEDDTVSCKAVAVAVVGAEVTEDFEAAEAFFLELFFLAISMCNVVK
jgi:hypothetical protein